MTRRGACFEGMILCLTTSPQGSYPQESLPGRWRCRFSVAPSFEPRDGDPLAGWHRVTLGVDARAESEAKADPAAAVSPGEWCHDVLTKIRDNFLVFSTDGVPVTNEGIAVVSIGCSFEVSWYGRDESARELWHLELPFVYAEV